MKTFSLKAGDIRKKWYLIDAKDLVVGRLAAVIAKILRGKNQPCLTPHLDHGDNIIIVNARHVHFTGNKDEPFYHHTGFPGGIKETSSSKILKGDYPDRVMRKAVERMMGKNGPLRRDRMSNLYIYGEDQHPHSAQKPEVLDVGSWNRKNRKTQEA
jgi:large subunit ribosomal protein L13